MTQSDSTDSSQSDAQKLLAQAQLVVHAGDEALRGLWPRAAAALTRQALETHARHLLTERGAHVDEVRFAPLMLATHAVMDSEAARELTQLWAQLSECLHHTELGTTLDVRVAVERAQAVINAPAPDLDGVPDSEPDEAAS